MRYYGNLVDEAASGKSELGVFVLMQVTECSDRTAAVAVTTWYGGVLLDLAAS